ncbi:MAG TPA: hypothetical protein VGY13_11690 [Solirubrobacteraceae bacterium]|nr:hypothetical protein [Solirubrobacteraceae bacterium]
MVEPPAQALARFRDELGPELYRARGFAVQDRQDGRLLFSDGIVEPEQPEPLEDPEGLGLLGRRRLRRRARGREGTLYSLLRRASARRLVVEFAAEGAGTSVWMRGRAEREVCRALQTLGAPGRWPQRPSG